MQDLLNDERTCSLLPLCLLRRVKTLRHRSRVQVLKGCWVDKRRPFAPWEGCCVCWEDGGTILLCDHCDAEFHPYCLDPPLPDVPAGLVLGRNLPPLECHVTNQVCLALAAVLPTFKSIDCGHEQRSAKAPLPLTSFPSRVTSLCQQCPICLLVDFMLFGSDVPMAEAFPRTKPAELFSQ